jgi:hypothetical protein
MRLLTISVLSYAAFFFAQPINLATADLGRHIVNGELVTHGVKAILSTNYYSFTEPAQPFINHHWASGVVFYLVHDLFGFKGLSVLYILLSLTALLLMVQGSKDRFGQTLPLLAAILVIPLFAYRVEVRPEGFSYVLLALYYYLFVRFRSGNLQVKWLLPMLISAQILWVNLHIFFFFGLAIAACFALDALLNSRAALKHHVMILVSLLAASLLNPHTYKGLLAPLTIFKEYGYMVAENQSVTFMLERFGSPQLVQFEVSAVVALVLIIFMVWKGLWKNLVAEILLVIAFGVLSAIAVRGIPLFAIFLIPLFSALSFHVISKLNFKTKELWNSMLPWIGSAFCLLFIMVPNSYVSARKGYEGLGLIEGIDGCGKFLRAQQIPGRIFNNYDFGGYLIYHLHDRQKVFVDNRPEAYTVAFFDSIYKPMQEDDAIWRTKSEEYGINVIVFYRLDNTPWAQPFLIRRTQDPDWVAIYVDEVSLVLVKNRSENERLIRDFAKPRSMFQGVPN